MPGLSDIGSKLILLSNNYHNRPPEMAWIDNCLE